MNKTINHVIGDRIRLERESRRLTGTQFGQKLGEYLGAPGWSRQTVYEAENGKRDFRISDLVALSLAHNIQLYDLVAGPKQIEISPGRLVPGGRVTDCFLKVAEDSDRGPAFRALLANQQLLAAVEDASEDLSKAVERATRVRETLSTLFAPHKVTVTTRPEPSVKLSRTFPPGVKIPRRKK